MDTAQDFLAADIVMTEPENIRGGTRFNNGISGPDRKAGNNCRKSYVIRKNGPKAKVLFIKMTLTNTTIILSRRTPSDWTNRDEKAVDAMLADPYYSLFQLLLSG